MPYKLTVGDADEYYQDYEHHDALAKFFEACAHLGVETLVQLQYEADVT